MGKPAIDDFSRSFYPFLHDQQTRPEDLMEEMTFSLLEKVRESVEVKTRFFEGNKEAIIAASLELAKAFQRGNKLLVCGNGGVVWAAQFIPSSLSALLVATVPLWMVLLDAIRPGGSSPGIRPLCGILLGFTGALLLIGLTRDGASPGNFYGALAVLTWSFLADVVYLFPRRHAA